MVKMNADLHTHTYNSDGVSTIEQNIHIARMNGLDALAITDHDTFGDPAKAQYYAKLHGITLIPAVEVSTCDHHILAYNVDVTNPILTSVLEQNRIKSEYEVSLKLTHMQGLGYVGTMLDVRAVFGSNPYGTERIGSVNFSTMLMLKNPQKFQGMTNYEVREFVKQNTTHIKVQAEHPKSAIAAIHAAGGVSILAHGPRNSITQDGLDELLSYGLDGVEIQPNEYNKKKSGEGVLSYTDLEKIAAEKKLIITAGSDYHGPTMNRPFFQKGTYPIAKFW
jgi:3',5'-nucleoside bisphosphate phosphatase